jgi:preprotein translocase subunit SecG
MSSGRIARHRNYTELMRQHDKEVRLKRVLRVFTYFLIILFLLILLLIIIRWEGKQSAKTAFLKIKATPEVITRVLTD